MAAVESFNTAWQNTCAGDVGGVVPVAAAELAGESVVSSSGEGVGSVDAPTGGCGTHAFAAFPRRSTQHSFSAVGFAPGAHLLQGKSSVGSSLAKAGGRSIVVKERMYALASMRPFRIMPSYAECRFNGNATNHRKTLSLAHSGLSSAGQFGSQP